MGDPSQTRAPGEDLGAVSGLDAEQREAPGGVRLVVPCALPWGEAALLLCLGLLLSPLALGPLVALWPGDGVPPWANPEVPPVALAIVVSTVGLYVGGCLVAASHIALYLYRAFGSSAGLVAGERALRVHGYWPWPIVLPWEQVKFVSCNRVCLLLWPTPGGKPQLWIHRLLAVVAGKPFRVYVPRRLDTQAVRDQLLALKTAADGAS
jgi:hypothetical protein